MLNEFQMGRYADVLLWGLKKARAARFEKNDVILIKYHHPAIALAEVIFCRIMEMGMYPVQRVVSTPRMEKVFFRLADDQLLTFQVPGESELLSRLNGSIFLNAPESITHLMGVDAGKIGKSMAAQKPLKDIKTRRESLGLFAWTLCLYPTKALADAAGIDLKTYFDQVKKACFLDETEPVSKWEELYSNAGQIKVWLKSLDLKCIKVESKKIDMEIGLGDHRKWIGISGRNIPSFEIFTSPDWRATHGVYFADQPSYRNGNYVKNVRLEFNRGKLVEVSAEEGEVFLKKQLKLDEGAGRVGEFSLTDRRFSKIDRFMANTLYDENFGGDYGNCHLAMGSSYENTFSKDRNMLTPEYKTHLGFNDSALHWDFVNTEPKRVVGVLKSGKNTTIYENGEFTY